MSVAMEISPARGGRLGRCVSWGRNQGKQRRRSRGGTGADGARPGTLLPGDRRTTATMRGTGAETGQETNHHTPQGCTPAVQSLRNLRSLPEPRQIARIIFGTSSKEVKENPRVD